jgi:hypothetical protein
MSPVVLDHLPRPASDALVCAVVDMRRRRPKNGRRAAETAASIRRLMANVDLTLVLGSEAPAVQRERFCQLGLALLSSVRLQVAVPTSCPQPAAALPYVAYESEHALRSSAR